MKISAHVLVGPTTRKDWLDQCLQSLDGQGIEVVIGDSVDGNLTAARLSALERQQTEWVSWVDPDDIVPAGAFPALAAEADAKAGLVTGDELVLRADGSVCGKGSYFGRRIGAAEVLADAVAAHKGIVRRESIPLAREIIGDLPFGICWALMLAGTLIGDVHKVLAPTYHWRLHQDQAHKRQRPDFNAIAARFQIVRSRLQ